MFSNERAVRILLECIPVFKFVSFDLMVYIFEARRAKFAYKFSIPELKKTNSEPRKSSFN